MPCTAAPSPCTVVMHGMLVSDGGGADLVAVERGEPPLVTVRRVDDQVDLAVEDELDDGRLAVGPVALAVLADDRRGDAVAPQHLGRALGGEDLEAEVGQRA